MHPNVYKRETRGWVTTMEVTLKGIEYAQVAFTLCYRARFRLLICWARSLFWSTSGPFLERPGNFSDLKASFKIKICWIVQQFLAHETIKIASFTDSFILLLSKLLRLWSWMQTQQTQNSFPGPKSYRDFRETVARSLCAHRFCSGAVQSTALYSLLSCCFKMESDRAKWSNHVHSYISRVLAQGKNTPPFFSDLPQLTY